MKYDAYKLLGFSLCFVLASLPGLRGLACRYGRIFSDVVATERSRLEVDVPCGSDGRSWARTDAVVDTQTDEALGPDWQRRMQEGVRHLSDETWVPANDPQFERS